MKNMKKLFFATVLSFGSLTAFAQDASEAQVDNTTEVVATQDDFSAIEISELPEAVSAAVAKSYPTASINKAYTNEAKQYKLEVSLEDGTAGTLYANADGSWIEL